MTVISMAIICDGTSDLCLQNIVEWIADTAFPTQAFRIFAAREVVPARGTLQERLRKAHLAYEPSMIICHRDAEAMNLQDRINEINAAQIASDLPILVVPAVPVRMIESWLLVDQAAIRCAADNKNGSSDLSLPSPNRIEQLGDPKEVLFTALRKASNLPPQRLKKFNENRARSRVASFIENFGSLRALQSFQLFEQRLIRDIGTLQMQLEKLGLNAK